MAHPVCMAPDTTSRYSDTQEGKISPPIAEYKNMLKCVVHFASGIIMKGQFNPEAGYAFCDQNSVKYTILYSDNDEWVGICKSIQIYINYDSNLIILYLKSI